MRKVTVALSAALGLCLMAQTAVAQKPWQFGPEISLGTSSYGPAIGGRAVWAGLGQAVKVPGLQAYGAFDYFFPSTSGFASSVHVWELNFNATYDIPNITGQWKPYVGAGINYANYSWSACSLCSGSQTGLNILGGTHFNPTPKTNLFGEVRIELRSASFIAFTVGMLF